MNDNDNRSENLNIDDGLTGNFDLESILVEYKSSAFIAGEKKTPGDELDEKIRLIISEAQDDAVSEPAPEAGAASKPGEVSPEIDENSEQRQVSEYSWGDLTEDERDFLDVTYAKAEAVEEYAQEVSEAAPDLEGEEDEKEPAPGLFARFRERRKELYEEEAQGFKAEDEREYGEIDEFAELENEPSLMDASRVYASRLHSYQIRAVFALIICFFMGYAVLAYGFDWPLPALLKDEMVFSITLLVMQSVVTLLGIGLFFKGIADIFRLKYSALSLVSVAGLISILDALHIILTQNTGLGLPYSAVAAFSMMFALWGEAYTRSAYKDTLRTSCAARSPNIVITEKGTLEDGRVIVKTPYDTRGFVTKAEQSDFAKYVYSFAAPMLLIGSLVLSVLGSIGNGNPEIFSHTFACLTAVSASFSSLVAFPLPFSKLAKRLSRSGAAIAGWWGACDIADAVGIVITDNDVFPAGTLSLNGMRVLGGVSKEKLVSYTGSIVSVSGSGLSKIFIDLIKTQNCALLSVEEFSRYEGGGVGAIVKGERVLVGSSGFMNLMGIRLPQSLNAKNAVFTAINDELVGVFSVNYTPVKSVQSSLVSLLEAKLSLLFAVRDFNISPLMIKQKFKIAVDNMEYITASERYRLSEERTEIKTLPSAILCREGLAPLAETVSGSSRLKSAVRSCTLISVVGAVIGLLLMFYLCRSLAFEAASTANILFFMGTWLLPVLIISGGADRY